MRFSLLAAVSLCGVLACSSDPPSDGLDAGGSIDLGVRDLGVVIDAGVIDSGVPPVDSGVPMPDGGMTFPDASEDGGVPQNIGALSDDFSGAALDPSWSFFHDDVADAVVENGAMTVRMTMPRLWFNNTTAALVYKPVTGNFKVTSRVHARKVSNSAEAPTLQYQLGGLMTRDPHGTDQGGQENYILFVVGHDGNDLSVEHKTTVNSQSDFFGPTWPSSDAELRICRVDTTFRLYKREIGANTWTFDIMYERPDLPATLQVGATVYGNANGMVDLQVSYDEITFAEATTEGDCSAD